MKKKLLVLATLAICAAIVATGTLAYFNAETQAHNVITTGRVDIELVEKTKDDSGTEIDFPTDGVSGVMPGASVSKIVSVKNVGEAEAWIRVWVNTAISEPGDPITNPTIKCLPLEIEVNGQMVPVITMDFDTENWVYEDGYYYYKQPVPVYEEKADGSVVGVTSTLFNKVTFAKEMGNEYQNCKVMIDVAAEAVQSKNNPIPENGDVTDIVGWPNA